MNIQSGPSSDRLRRAGIWTVALLAVGLWFAYDGWVGYPHQNRQEYSEQFPNRPAAETVKVQAEVTPELLAQLGTTGVAAEAEKRLGPPTLRTELDSRWFGPAGTLVVPANGSAAFKPAKRTATDILVQRAIGVALLAAFLVSAALMLRLRSQRYVLDERGLTIPGAATIAWAAMSKLDGDQVEEKGWVQLHFNGNGGQQTVRLDSFEIAEFGPMIDAICEHKGFENPLPVKSG